METVEQHKKNEPEKTDKAITVISDDEDYFRRGFHICGLYRMKRSLLSGLKKEWTQEKKDQITRLVAQIEEEEGVFWRDAEQGVKSGAKYAFEELSKKFSLDPLEKKVLLFFLFLEFRCIDENVCTETELLELFTPDDSVCGRIRGFKCFRRDAPLIKNKLLLHKEADIRSSAQLEYALCGLALDLISREVCGDAAGDGCVDKECEEDRGRRTEKKKVEDVGYVLEPRFRFDDVVLPESLRDKVRFFLRSHAEPELAKTGILDIVKKGRGLVFLFYGPPGTGKSMLAEGIAAHLGKKMLMAEMPKLTCRWYGETDKALSKLFRLAKEQDMVLCMDEADSFLYNREYGAQEHDIRFVNVMLSEIENFEGVAVFTTNMDKLLDPALERRVTLRVPFTAPDEGIRARIWENHVPKSMRVADGVDFMDLAKRFEFAGGYIKNAVLNAVRRVVLDRRNALTMDDLVWGAQMEHDGIFNAQMKKKNIGFAF
ncbi:MAG TPA: ATP-binding protein [Candidatus Omnitrophota bacterium]|jgi:AAA+ superfamily predicted ATPase|nr:ATP-binding protein [Candidatus Omnitrophota bacterium]